MSSGQCVPETFGRAHCYSDLRVQVIVMSNESVAPSERTVPEEKKRMTDEGLVYWIDHVAARHPICRT